MTKKKKEGAARPQIVKDPFLKALKSAFGDEFEIYKNGVEM